LRQLTKPKKLKMKKVFAIVALTAFMAACNNEPKEETTEATADTTAAAPADTTTAAPAADTTAKVDTAAAATAAPAAEAK
jgi:PBP1b-binding outer membrane lipoprotein LpoB